jgi:hypothetical protein
LLQISITDDDLWPTSSSTVNHEAVKTWFTKQGKCIRKLRVDIRKWETNYCSLETLETLLAEILCAVHGSLSHLVLAVEGAPLVTAHAWLHLASKLSNSLVNGSPTLWPRLCLLEINIDGKGAASQAQASHAARQVMSTLPYLKSLRKVAINLISTKLCILPPVLGICDQIEELTLNFAANGEPAGLVLPAKRPSSLLLPPNLKKLSLINPPFAFEDVINAVNKRNYKNLDTFAVSSTV